MPVGERIQGSKSDFIVNAIPGLGLIRAVCFHPGLTKRQRGYYNASGVVLLRYRRLVVIVDSSHCNMVGVYRNSLRMAGSFFLSMAVCWLHWSKVPSSAGT